MIKDTLTQRGNRYGSFEDNAELTQSLMELIESKRKLPYAHKEAIHMIFHKISRIVCGDLWYADNAHDIAGYATLLEEYINQFNNECVEDELDSYIEDSCTCTLASEACDFCINLAENYNG